MTKHTLIHKDFVDYHEGFSLRLPHVGPSLFIIHVILDFECFYARHSLSLFVSMRTCNHLASQVYYLPLGSSANHTLPERFGFDTTCNDSNFELATDSTDTLSVFAVPIKLLNSLQICNHISTHSQNLSFPCVLVHSFTPPHWSPL